MKKIMLMGLLSLFTSISTMAQTKTEKAVKQTIIEFAKAGDNSDAVALEKLLDANYRVVMNRLFGSKEVSVVSRAVYLEKIKTKEWGGDTRKVSIQSAAINGSTASVLVSFKGTKSTFISFITLVSDEHGNWKLIGDVPMIN